MKNIFYKNNCKMGSCPPGLFPAFTLAEVLITLAVIGVVAVLAIGIFIPKIQDKVLAAQEKTAKIKFTKAMEQMALNSKIGPLYNDTEEFVSELQNYLKVAKVCDNEHLADCFGYESFVDTRGEIIALNDIKDGKGFNLPKDNANDFEGDTKGIVTIDGTPMVLAWNKKCEILEPGVYEWSGNTNISTSCVAAVMDINGTKRPDKLGKDIALLNASNIGACIQFTVNGQTYKWGCPFEPKPLSYSECIALKNTGKITTCLNNTTTGCLDYCSGKCCLTAEMFWVTEGGDRWAGAVQTCGGTNKIPNNADLSALATYLYDRESNPIGATQSINSNITLSSSKLSALSTELYAQYVRKTPFFYSDSNYLGHSTNWFRLWSGQEGNDKWGAYRNFTGTSTTYDYPVRSNISVLAVCKM